MHHNKYKVGFNDEATLYLKYNLFFNKYVKFIKKVQSPCVDIAHENVKMQHIKDKLNFNVDYLMPEDLNYNRIPFKKKYRTIFFFETLEHLQNPLFVMKQLRDNLYKDGIIYLSLPHRPRILWTNNHFFEMSPKHLNKWILAPLDLYIVRKKHIRIPYTILFYMKGFRPLLRIFLNYTVIYEIRKEEKQ